MSISPKFSNSRPLSAGDVIAGQYAIQEQLGKGGFALVYKARQLRLKRLVAVKVLLLSVHPDERDTNRDRLMLEAISAAQIDHPNIVTVHDVGLLEHGEPYIVMEYLEGHDLAAELALSGPLQPARAVRLMKQTLGGLARVHRQGVIHRDIKPHNLFVAEPHSFEERLKIIDFGVAKMHSHIRTHTEETHRLGTLLYLAPEYIRDNTVSASMDVYQTGMTFLELLTGQHPIQVENEAQAILKIVHGELEWPDALRQTPLGQVLAQAIHVDPAVRFQNASAFRDALDRIDESTLVCTWPTESKMADSHQSFRHIRLIDTQVVNAKALESRKSRAATVKHVSGTHQPSPGRGGSTASYSEDALLSTQPSAPEEPVFYDSREATLPHVRLDDVEPMPTLVSPIEPTEARRSEVEVEARDRESTAPLPLPLPTGDAPSPPTSGRRRVAGIVVLTGVVIVLTVLLGGLVATLVDVILNAPAEVSAEPPASVEQLELPPLEPVEEKPEVVEAEVEAEEIEVVVEVTPVTALVISGAKTLGQGEVNVALTDEGEAPSREITVTAEGYANRTLRLTPGDAPRIKVVLEPSEGEVVIAAEPDDEPPTSPPDARSDAGGQGQSAEGGAQRPAVRSARRSRRTRRRAAARRATRRGNAAPHDFGFME